MKSLISKIYEAIVNSENRKFDSGECEVHRTRAKLISIGNISVGGTGKTPLTETLARFIIDSSKSVAIAGRGYKGDFKGNLLVRDNHQIYTSAKEAGDEMFMLARNLQIPIAVNSSKYLAAKYLDETFSPDYIILDDGFQHRKLHRDLDIIILDKKSVDNPHTFPKGLLREPFSNISRADIICHYGDFPIPNDIKSDKLVTIKTKYLGLFTLDNFPNEIADSSILVSALGANKKFHNSCREIGVNVRDIFEYRDHHKYTKSDVKKIISSAYEKKIKQVITTEKDIVKLLDYKDLFLSNSIELVYLKIQTEIVQNIDFLYNKILSLCENKG